MKKLVCLIAMLVCLSMAGTVKADLFSGFNADGEGWGVVNDANPIVYHNTGGNPGGFISAQDIGLGQTFYFSAPAKFRGDLSPYIGGTLAYDILLMVKGGNYYDNVNEVIIKGAGQTIGWSNPVSPQPPLNVWTSYNVQLLATNFGVDSATFSQVMADVTALWIRGEYINGADTEGLDNVLVSAAPAVPLPGTVWLLGAGLVGLASLRRRR